MITPRQIRAARALAAWTMEDLAVKTSLTADTITNIETARTQPREGTLERIVKAFDLEGIEFTENEGVRRKPVGVEIFEGRERFDAFYDFLYEHLKLHGGEICLSAVDEGMFAKFRNDPELHRRRMKELSDAGKITVRILTSISDFKSSYATFRQIPIGTHTTPTSFYAFGSCLALISFDYQPAPYVVLHKSGPFAEAYKHAFNLAWEAARPPPAAPV
jgi:transcriptional regulator with XRE-family HTH domain